MHFAFPITSILKRFLSFVLILAILARMTFLCIIKMLLGHIPW